MSFRDSPEHHYRRDLRAGKAVAAEEDRRAILLDEIQKPSRHELFWAWRQEYYFWNWQYMVDEKDNSIILLLKRKPFAFLGVCMCC